MVYFSSSGEMDGSPTGGGRDLEFRYRRRGRAYLCRHCFHKEGKKHVDVKARVRDHILRQHIAFHQVPFYCNLCSFRCLKWDQLVKNVSTYKRHTVLALKSRILDNSKFLLTNPNPYVIGAVDYRQFSAEESTKHFMSVSEAAEEVRRELPLSVQNCMPEESSDLCPLQPPLFTPSVVPEYIPTPISNLNFSPQISSASYLPGPNLTDLVTPTGVAGHKEMETSVVNVPYTVFTSISQ